MAYTTKIATCCYCGSRAALVLGKDRHELTCASCGAPLHDMKRFREATPARPVRTAGPSQPSSHQPSRSRPVHQEPLPRKYPKKRKSIMRFLVKEAFDVIEDIFD